MAEESEMSTGMKLLTGLSPYGQIANGIMDFGKNIFGLVDYLDNKRYSRELQKKVWEREDSLIQRRVADAQLAGINPLAAMGMGGSAQLVSMPDYNSGMAGTGLAQTLIQTESQKEMQAREFEQQVEMWEKEAENIKNEKEAERLFTKIQNELDRKMQTAINNQKVQAEREKTRKDYEQAMKEIERKKNEFAKQLAVSEKTQKHQIIQGYITSVGTIATKLGLAVAGL